MRLSEAKLLIQNGEFSVKVKSTWADLGCGSGLFTKALGAMLYPGSTIYAVDRNLVKFSLVDTPDQILIRTIKSDFASDEFQLNGLDGILMANAFHFVENKNAFLNRAKTWFRNKPFYLIVEYNTDKPNPWVPYPVSFQSLVKLFAALGYTRIEKLHEINSLYNSGKMYSAVATL
jgi:ubiquinone/menaquinone biosynthesis C-methylase UbiE